MHTYSIQTYVRNTLSVLFAALIVTALFSAVPLVHAQEETAGGVFNGSDTASSVDYGTNTAAPVYYGDNTAAPVSYGSDTASGMYYGANTAGPATYSADTAGAVHYALYTAAAVNYANDTAGPVTYGNDTAAPVTYGNDTAGPVVYQNSSNNWGTADFMLNDPVSKDTNSWGTADFMLNDPAYAYDYGSGYYGGAGVGFGVSVGVGGYSTPYFGTGYTTGGGYYVPPVQMPYNSSTHFSTVYTDPGHYYVPPQSYPTYDHTSSYVTTYNNIGSYVIPGGSYATYYGSAAPTCSIWLSSNTVAYGQATTLNWSSAYAQSGSISYVGPVGPSGSTQVTPGQSMVYTATFVGVNGQVVHCSTGVGIAGYPVVGATDGNITLSQVPYKGLDLGPVGTALYWSFLVLWCLLAAYLIVVKRVQVRFMQWFARVLVGTHTMAHGKAPVHTPAAVSPEGLFSQHDLKALAQMILNSVDAPKSVPHAPAARTTDATDDFILSQVNRARA